ncbi:MAG: site-specific integrase [Xanthomonadales bacterium]|nr:site-specific integrase [Xanthomonadales bacterium]
MTQSTKPISPLRQRMIDDMTLRKLAPKTQKTYLRAVQNFTRFFGQSPDAATAEDLRRYQLHLVQQGTSSGTLNATLTGLRFFFEVTLDRPGTMKHTSHVNLITYVYQEHLFIISRRLGRCLAVSVNPI